MCICNWVNRKLASDCIPVVTIAVCNVCLGISIDESYGIELGWTSSRVDSIRTILWIDECILDLLLLLVFVVMELLHVGGDVAITPGRGRCNEHTTIVFSDLSSLLWSVLFSALSLQQIQANTGVPNLDADSIAFFNCVDWP